MSFWEAFWSRFVFCGFVWFLYKTKDQGYLPNIKYHQDGAECLGPIFLSFAENAVCLNNKRGKALMLSAAGLAC